MKNYLGECSSKVTRPNGERSKILVTNPAEPYKFAWKVSANNRPETSTNCLSIYLQ